VVNPIVGPNIQEEFIKGMELFGKSEYMNALRIFEMCSQSNYPASFIMLAYLHGNSGYIGTTDKNREQYWIDNAKTCCYNFFLGYHDPHPSLIFSKGLFFSLIHKDPRQAFQHFSSSAEQNYSPAQFHVGYCYHYGIGVPTETSLALKNYQLSAENGFLRAEYYLGYCYQYGVGVQTDNNVAVRHYLSAANKGDPDAQCNLGYCYQNGVGMPVDLPSAVKYYRLSADQGQATAQFNLAYCLQYGFGATLDLIQAAKYYQLAADQNYSPAIFNIAECYEKGFGVDKNIQTAAKYYQQCPNNPTALSRLQALKKQQSANPEACLIQ